MFESGVPGACFSICLFVCLELRYQMARGAARSGAKNGTKASLTNCRTKLWKRLNFPIDFEVLLSQKERMLQHVWKSVFAAILSKWRRMATWMPDILGMPGVQWFQDVSSWYFGEVKAAKAGKSDKLTVIPDHSRSSHISVASAQDVIILFIQVLESVAAVPRQAGVCHGNLTGCSTMFNMWEFQWFVIVYLFASRNGRTFFVIFLR